MCFITSIFCLQKKSCRRTGVLPKFSVLKAVEGSSFHNPCNPLLFRLSRNVLTDPTGILTRQKAELKDISCFPSSEMARFSFCLPCRATKRKINKSSESKYQFSLWENNPKVVPRGQGGVFCSGLEREESGAHPFAWRPLRPSQH